MEEFRSELKFERERESLSFKYIVIIREREKNVWRNLEASCNRACAQLLWNPEIKGINEVPSCIITGTLPRSQEHRIEVCFTNCRD